MTKALKYFFILSLIVFTLFSALHLYHLIEHIYGEYFTITIFKKGGLLGTVLLFILFSITFTMGVIALFRIIKRTKFPIRLYCDICAMLAISLTAIIFMRELVIRNYYFLNLDYSNLTHGLIQIAAIYLCIFLTLKLDQDELTT